MRLTYTIALALLVAVAAADSALAQSSTRNAISSAAANVFTPQAGISAPMAGIGVPSAPSIPFEFGAPTGSVAPSMSAPVFQNPIGAAPTMSSPIMSSSVMSSPVMSSPMAYSGPINSGASYSPLSMGEYPQGRACCDLTPTPQVVPTLKPVTSCCSQNGRLGVPPLLTPIRYDMPPIGKAVGRPLFGRWNGY